jgi:hypoxanthine-DNA glycosylase
MTNEILPVYDAFSKILILGSFPSVKSRAAHFFYGHPKNRFWPLLALLLNASVPVTVAQKKALLLRHHIALWDVVQSCDIKGSSDSSITNVVPNDIAHVVASSQIHRVFTNGQTAHRLYGRHCQFAVGLPATLLPSTSPANANKTMDALASDWRTILAYL